MTHGKTSRRQFVRLAGGLALPPRHGLLPAQTATGAPPAPQDRAAATHEDSAQRIEWDAKLHARISRRTGPHWIPLTAWGRSRYPRREDGQPIARFAFRHQVQATVDDVNGPGTRLTLSGTAVDGVEKTVTV